MKTNSNHLYYYISDEVLCEAYQTIRGMRYREICKAPGMPNTEKCTAGTAEFIKKENKTNQPKKYKNV